MAELDANGSIQALNTFGANGLVSRHTTATNASVFYTFDERGNLAQRLDSSGVLSTDLYDAFGARTGTVPPSDPWGFGAQWGYQSDTETGLVLCTNRYYDPQQGRFATRDPSGYGGGVNLYSYTQNNPVNGMDPSGLHVDDNYWGGFGKPEDGVPAIGPVGASVNRNVAEAQSIRNVANQAFYRDKNGNMRVSGIGTVMTNRAFLYDWYIDQVRTGHRWDYKYHTHSDIAPGEKRGTYLFDNYGNFNAGAVAAALGLSRAEAIYGADIFHVKDHPTHPFPYPEDHGDEWIGKGFDWYMKTHECKK